MHDWTRVPAGIYHDFHNAWITELRNWLNSGHLPMEYYAVGEQRAGEFGPDVLTLHSVENPPSISRLQPVDDNLEGDAQREIVAVAAMPPKVRTTLAFDPDLAFYSSRQRQIAIRHSSGDEIVAIIEIVSPANKRSLAELNRFLEKIKGVLLRGIHVMIIDPFPPGTFDSHGLPFEVAQILGDAHERVALEASRNRSLSAYDAGEWTAYVEPLAVGDALSAMPLFLRPGHYLNIDLQSTYDAAYQFFPNRFKQVLETSS